MAWDCCCSSSFAATTSAVAVPAIYAAARTPNSFTITIRRRQNASSQSQSIRNPKIQFVSPNFIARSKATESELKADSSPSNEMDCIGTGLDVECVINPTDDLSEKSEQVGGETRETTSALVELLGTALEWGLLMSPFFFWGTAMVAMKEVLPKTGPFVVAAFRLIPSGFLVVGFAASRGRGLPSGFNAWLSISVFAAIDASCFQGFLAEGLERTTAGLGSVIIDSQPLTVAVLASLLFGESIGYIGAAGLVLGIIGLLLLEVTLYITFTALLAQMWTPEVLCPALLCTLFLMNTAKSLLQVPALAFDANNFSLWGSGEWWMFLAAQSMAIGTVMVRWVSKYSDPVMATGWHMVIGGLPLMAIAILNHDPALSSFHELTTSDVLALLYTSIFGSAISYGVYFYNATRGSLTKLSSLTFLTPMFASLFGFIYLGETFSPLQLVGALVTVAAIYMVNYKSEVE